MRLSVAAIERLKPDPTKRREVADAGKPGLYLVIQPQPSGKKSWAVRYRFQGESRKLTLPGFPSIETARTLAQGALDAAAAGRDPAAEKRVARLTPSNRIEVVFAEFQARYTRKRDGKPIRLSTRRETGRLLGLKLDAAGEWVPRVPKSGVLAHWMGRDVQTIAKRDVLSLLDDIVERGAPVAANRTLSALKTFFAWCVSRDILASSPCDHVNDPSPETSDERDFSDAELAAIWRAAEGEGHPYGTMVQLILIMGQRRDEVRQGVRAEVDRPNRLWKIPGARTKNGREHHVPLSDTAMRILDALPKVKSKQGWLFTLGGAVPVSNLARRKRRLDKAVRVELRKINPEAPAPAHWKIHHLRHALKTWMQKTRIAKDVRNAVQNHYDGDMDELYGHYTFEKEKREALDAWARHVESLLGGAADNVVSFRATLSK